MKPCTPKDLAAYRNVLLEKGLGFKLPAPAADLCVAVLEKLSKRDRNVFLAGRFSDGKKELLLLPPDEKVLRRFAVAFHSVEDTKGALALADVIEKSLGAEEAESKHEQPGWDGTKWVGEEKKRLADAGYYRFEKTPPGGYPPPVRGDKRNVKLDFKEKGVEVFCVQPWRLHREGDIYSSTSVHLLSDSRVKTPGVKSFEHDGRLWVAMGGAHRGPFTYYCDGYELVPASQWKGGKKAMAFGYYGRKVSVRGKPYVLGKKAKFVPENAKTCR